MTNGAGPNRYNSTPRKVFDKYIDRMAVRRQRDLDDHRGDLKLVFRMIRDLDNKLTELHDHVASHCRTLRDPEDPVVEHGTEELG